MSDTVRFFVNGAYHEVVSPAPTTTILEYLRERLALTGSKEGCAEGDCGACTVVIVEPWGDHYRIRTVNSCIQFLPTIDGKEIITVEGLKDDAGRLHPVQQAMVDCHGSQCGFCTPGFVMSLFQLYQTKENPSREDINHALAGNLCRCTGYRPIIDAATQMYSYAGDFVQQDWRFQPNNVASANLSSSETELIGRLKQIQRCDTLAIDNGQRYFAPKTLVDLCDLVLAYPNATILSGGTDVGLWVTKQFRELPEIIYVGDVRELYVMTQTDTHVEIPAGVTLTDAFQCLERDYPGLHEVFRRFASPPICNAGTLVGNVANGSPIGDSMPALMCIEATVLLQKGGQQRELALDDFYLAYQKTALEPGEFVVAIRVPRPTPNTVMRSYKLSKRYDQDISAVCGAYRLDLVDGTVDNIAICYGGMAAIPKRAAETEQALQGKPWTQANVVKASENLQRDYAPISDMRASADYRNLAARNLLTKFFHETSGSERHPRVFSVTGVTA